MDFTVLSGTDVHVVSLGYGYRLESLSRLVLSQDSFSCVVIFIGRTDISGTVVADVVSSFLDIGQVKVVNVVLVIGVGRSSVGVVPRAAGGILHAIESRD